MRLEDTIHFRLFRTCSDKYARPVNNDFIIECKGEKGKPVPLCIHPNEFLRTDLVYRQLYLSDRYCQERSTPRALYNALFNDYFNDGLLRTLKIKNIIYYGGPGILFNANKVPLFYFAYTLDEAWHMLPRLYITPTLLNDATASGKPMEKFFMSTVIPYLVNNTVVTGTGYEGNTVIEIDNQVDNTFFMPNANLLGSTSVNHINNRLNSILANNADVLSTFVENYRNVNRGV